MDNHYIECDCHSEEHTLCYSYDPEDNELYTRVFLRDWESWYKRLWKAAVYVFGGRTRWGHFDTTVMSGDQLYVLRDVVEKAIREKEAREKL